MAQVALEMKPACERCGANLPPFGDALVCSYECSFCLACGGEMDHICPNCGGELVRRPRRRVAEEKSMPSTHRMWRLGVVFVAAACLGHGCSNGGGSGPRVASTASWQYGHRSRCRSTLGRVRSPFMASMMLRKTPPV